MKWLPLLVLSFCLTSQACPANAADDVSFLAQLGGTVAGVQHGQTAVKFPDGTVVVINGSNIATTDVNGTVYTSDPESKFFAVSLPGHGVICYPSPIQIADVARASESH